MGTKLDVQTMVAAQAVPPPQPPRAVVRAVQEERTEKRGSVAWEAKVAQAVPPPQPPRAAARAVQEERTENRGSVAWEAKVVQVLQMAA